jgi:PAS domain S-box-containing protein
VISFVFGMYDFKNVFYFHATLNPQGVIADIGGRILQEAETDRQTLIGKNFSEIGFWNHNKNIAENIKNSIKLSGDGKPLEIETTLQTNPEKISIIKAKFTPIFDQSRQVEKIIFSSTDVSEYIKEIDFHKKRSERFLFAAECAEVGLWFWKTNEAEIFTTPRCNEIYGLSPNEVMTYENFIKPVYTEDLPSVMEALHKSQTELADYNIDYRIQAEDGKIRWLAVRGKTFQEDNDLLVMMGSVRDVTHQKLADERLQRLYEIEKNARDEVEEANLQKDHFLAIVSHELRAPLQTILGWAKIMLTQNVEPITRQKALETIENSAKMQAKLISDLVDSAKIISGTLDFSLKTVALDKLIGTVVQAQKPLADEKQINLVLGKVTNLQVLGDEVRLQQALTNLLTNAIKFTPNNGAILVQLSENNGKGNLCITDSGPGIPANDLPFIFKQYFQSKTSNNKTGLGLGLSIVKAIVEKHGGQVTARNNENGIGCTFSISLPVYFNTPSEPLPIPAKLEECAMPLENVKILVVEDNEDSLEVLDFYLTQLGAKIHPAISAREGMSFLTTTASLPDVIISDISMPEEDGYTFIKKVRNLPETSELPAIALTAFASSNDEKRVLEAGFQKYHTKPFQPDLLISDILEVVGK